MGKIIDISVSFPDKVIIYPGDPVPEIKTLRSQEEGDRSNFSIITTGTHSGTHIDAPYHFLSSGPKIDEIPVDLWIGKAYVADLTFVEECVRDSDLAGIPLGKYERILIKTKNSQLYSKTNEFCENFIYMHESACKRIVDAGVKILGFDYTTVDKAGMGVFPAHKTLFAGNVCIIESVNLSEVDEGEYELICLPLKLKGIEASPVRAVLVKD